MGMKRIRTGKFIHLGWFPFYQYEDHKGAHTLVGIDHLVQFVVEITDGPDAGREVRVTMTQQDAAAHISAVREAIATALSMSEELEAHTVSRSLPDSDGEWGPNPFCDRETHTADCPSGCSS